MDKTTYRIINDISLRTNTPFHIVENIIKSQYELLRLNVYLGELDNPDSFPIIKLNKFGKFIPNKRKIKIVNKYKQLKKQKNEARKEASEKGGNT